MTYWGFVVRNASRNRVRASLTVAAIALATTLVCMMLTMPAGFERLITDLSSLSRVAVHAKAGFVYPLPPSYLDKVRAMKGVVAASSSTWFGGIHDAQRGVEFASFAVDPEAASMVFADYPISKQAFDGFIRERQGALVGRATLLAKGWKVGDRVSLESPGYGVTLDFRILGAIENPHSGDFWFQRRYLDETLRSRGQELRGIGTVWARVGDERDVPAIMRAVQAQFETAEVQATSETERDFNADLYGGMEGILGIVSLVTSIIGLSIVFIGASTASIAVRERAGEVAVLRALGFPRSIVLFLLMAETTLLAALGGACGVGAAFVATGLLRAASERAGGMLSMLQAFVVSPGVAAQALIVALTVGLVAGLFPALAALRQTISSSFKEVF